MHSDTKTAVVDTGTQTDQRGAETSSAYTNTFFARRKSETWEAALRIVPHVLEYTQPGSVVDVGCATGEFLAAFGDNGIEDIYGIDGAYVQKNLLVIPQEKFRPLDLNRPFTLDRTFDLAVCLEVAEHLRPQSAAHFIASLSKLAPVILFSAAIPYQGGTSHLNEQWPEYWAELFQQHGFVPVDALREHIWLDRGISIVYRQNMLFFCKEEVFALNEKLRLAFRQTNPFDLSRVHPEMFLARMSEFDAIYARIPRYFFTRILPLGRIKRGILHVFGGKAR
jgi:SAM-dependent methyltransferase